MPNVLAQPGSSRGRPLLRVAAGVLVVALVAATGLNQNLLYLSIVLSLYLVAATAVRSLAAVAASLLLTVLVAGRPFSVPAVDFLAPEAGARERTLRAGDTLTYRFFLRGVKPFADARGHVVAELKVDGRHLGGLEVRIEGAEHTGGIQRARKYDYEQARLSFEVIGDQDVSVVLDAQPGTQPSILVGPEVDHLEVYPHAVYVEVGNARRSLTFHSTRPHEAVAAQ